MSSIRLTQNNRINQEVKKRRLKWIGHVLRKPRNHHCMIALTWHPDGRRKIVDVLHEEDRRGEGQTIVSATETYFQMAPKLDQTRF